MTGKQQRAGAERQTDTESERERWQEGETHREKEESGVGLIERDRAGEGRRDAEDRGTEIDQKPVTQRWGHTGQGRGHMKGTE